MAATNSIIDSIATASANGSNLRVTLHSGRVLDLPTLWCRDNCRCSECRITSTGEHRYFFGNVPELAALQSVDVDDATMTLSWSDGHRSYWSANDIAEVLATASRDHPAPQAWKPMFEPARLSWQSIIEDPSARIECFNEFMVHGAVIVTGTPTQTGECLRFLDTLGIPIRETPFDRLHDVFFRSDGYNVAHSDEPLPPHNDFASYQSPPSGQLLHFLVNEVSGGDSILVDALRVIDELHASDPDAADLLAAVPIAFREHSDTAESWARAPLLRRNPDGSNASLRFSNQLMQPLHPDEPHVDEWYRAYHKLALLVMSAHNQLRFRSEPGDMQIVHAHRMLHGRTGFDGSAGARHLQDTYFEYDDLAAQAAILTGQAR